MDFGSADNMLSSFNDIDRNIDKMIQLLQDEQQKLDESFVMYLNRIKRAKRDGNYVSLDKFEQARKVFEQARLQIRELTELIEPLQHIKQVNRMVTFSMKSSEAHMFIEISSFLDAISNICLGQLKYIRARYKEILSTVRLGIAKLWMDRELAHAIRLILSVNQIQYNKFLVEFKQTEVRYADISLSIKSSTPEEFHQRIVLRMVSNRLPSMEEQRIIQTLFPSWDKQLDFVA